MKNLYIRIRQRKIKEKQKYIKVYCFKRKNNDYVKLS